GAVVPCRSIERRGTAEPRDDVFPDIGPRRIDQAIVHPKLESRFARAAKKLRHGDSICRISGPTHHRSIFATTLHHQTPCPILAPMGLGPGIHEFAKDRTRRRGAAEMALRLRVLRGAPRINSWMPGPRPGMTVCAGRY